MARQKSLTDIEKRIEKLKQEKEELLNDMALSFAKKLIKDEKVSTKQELNEWYKMAQEAIAFKADYEKKLKEHQEAERRKKAQAAKQQKAQQVTPQTVQKQVPLQRKDAPKEQVKKSQNSADAELAKYGITI